MSFWRNKSMPSPIASSQRKCRFELMEERRMLDANPLLLGAVYVEQDLGTDAHQDTLEVTFEGGAAGAEITRLIIDGDQLGNFGNAAGFSSGDVFFDTEPGGLGADSAVPFNASLQSSNGAQILSANVADGASLLTIELANFVAGDKLFIGIDVDEALVVDPSETDIDVINSRFDPIASGAEFAGSILTAHVSAPHYLDEIGSAEFLNAYDAEFAQAAALGLQLSLPSDNQDSNQDRTAGALVNIVQKPQPIAIEGSVFYDRDADSQFEPAQFERGIADVELELWRQESNGAYAQVVQSGSAIVATTDNAGHYAFEESLGLTPGVYQIRERQPLGYLSVASIPGSVQSLPTGVSVNADQLSDISIPHGGTRSVGNDFAETRPAAVSGFVYHDRNNDGQKDSGEEGIEQVGVELLDASGNFVALQLTGPDGRYEFNDLLPGVYSIRELQPARWVDGKETAGQIDRLGQGLLTVGVVQPDRFDNIALFAEESGRNYNFGEQLGSLRGRVFNDRDGDCRFHTGDAAIEGVEIKLRDEFGNEWTTRTNSSGEYRFDDLMEGLYTVIELQPGGYIHGGQIAGNVGGDTTIEDQIGEILLSGREFELTGYDFCENLGSIDGNVYHDRNDNGAWDSGEEAIAGVSIELIDANGASRQTTTDANGHYEFVDLGPGQFTVIESQPGRWLDGKESLGAVAGAPNGIVHSDRFSEITLSPQNLVGENYNFGERLGSLAGRVFNDRDGDCLFEVGDVALQGVEIRLRDELGNEFTTLTNGSGEYRFDELMGGVYTVIESQPGDYIHGGQIAGNVGGDVSIENQIGGILLSGRVVELTGYDFCESLGSIDGNVYHDRNDNGAWDAGEEPIPGAVIELIGPTGAASQTTTDADGHYEFVDLGPGQFTIIESQPIGWLDGKESLGTVGGAANGVVQQDRFSEITLSAQNLVGQDYNFGERKGSIAGIVHVDLNQDCELDPGEIRLADVEIFLLDQSGQLLQSTTTNANGEYTFTSLDPGEYFVVENQPSGYFHGGQRVGSHGGDAQFDDVLGSLVVGPNSVNLTDYNFCELPPSTLSGYVFQDGPPIQTEDGLPPENIRHFRDGLLTPDDTPIADVVLELRNGLTGEPIEASSALAGQYAPGPIQVTTDANGFYEFQGIRGGANYAVFQVQPSAYIDGLDTPGTTSGLAVNPTDNLSPLVLSQLTSNPNNDAIIRIPLGVGQASELNNFSEILVESSPPPPRLPPPPLQTPPLPQAIGPAASPIFTPPQPPTATTIPLFGSGSLANYTWHLSIIDGGTPRGDLPQDGSIEAAWVDVSVANSMQWREADLNSAQWSKLVFESGQPVVIGQALFGAPGAIPISGDFNGDGRSEVGVFIDGHWFLDLDGNGRWSSGDLWAKLGDKHDKPVTGDWDGDGKDDIGVFGPMWEGDIDAIEKEPGVPDVANRTARVHKNPPPLRKDAAHGDRLMQTTQFGRTRTDLIDHVFGFGVDGQRPITGDFNGDGISTIGVFNNGQWRLDANGDGQWDADRDHEFDFGQPGDVPVVGDFDGDGVDDVSVVRAGRWIIDSDGDRELTAHDRVFELDGAKGSAVGGDWNGDGRDELGFFQQTAPGA